jgi:C-3',4' desaturase CrtD
MKQVVVVGAGFGGLAAAAELSRAGFDVTVLEAHVYPGGCASTFYHQGYQFEAGATLAGGFAPGAPMDMLGRHFEIDWQSRPDEQAMQVHFPDRIVLRRWSDHDRWVEERNEYFGKKAESFWRWQENTADLLWDYALQLPPWPPQSLRDLIRLSNLARSWAVKPLRYGSGVNIPSLISDAFRPVATHLVDVDERLRLFVDAQLLISAQTTSSHANALYGSVALDLPRRGVVHVPGGIGGMANRMVDAVLRFGGRVYFHQQVVRVDSKSRGHFVVRTKRDAYPADVILFNLLPWDIAPLLGDAFPHKPIHLPNIPKDGWGAFVLYIGVDESVVKDIDTLHHQVILREPLGEGNTAFLSLSPDWDMNRAPIGRRAMTISTHTRLAPWWQLYKQDRDGYEQWKATYVDKLFLAAERVLPGLRSAARLILPGTPVTFQRFTHRAQGWVGGFPQTSLFRSWAPRLAKNIWMVGDTIFPGQSIPAVAMGGLRVARTIIDDIYSVIST